MMTSKSTRHHKEPINPLTREMSLRSRSIPQFQYWEEQRRRSESVDTLHFRNKNVTFDYVCQHQKPFDGFGDLDEYFERFEELMKAWDVPRRLWKLVFLVKLEGMALFWHRYWLSCGVGRQWYQIKEQFRKLQQKQDWNLALCNVPQPQDLPVTQYFYKISAAVATAFPENTYSLGPQGREKMVRAYFLKGLRNDISLRISPFVNSDLSLASLVRIARAVEFTL